MINNAVESMRNIVAASTKVMYFRNHDVYEWVHGHIETNQQNYTMVMETKSI